MTEIKLTRGKIAIIDDEFAHLKNYPWNFHSMGYASSSYLDEHGKRRPILLHHAIVGFPLNGLEVDHINGDKLDCRKENLRIVSHRKNLQNQKCHRLGNLVGAQKKIEKYKNSVYVRWVSAIEINGKPKHLGSFKTEKEAHAAYKSAIMGGLNFL